MSTRLLRLFLPLPMLAIALAAALSLFDWFFVVKTGLLALDDGIVEYWLPFLLALILAGVFISPRLRILALDPTRLAGGLFQWVAVAAIAAPAMVAQGYVHAAAGDLVHVRDIALAAPGDTARYFTADTACLDRGLLAAEPVVARDHGQLTVDLYVAVPACREGDTRNSQPAVWIGFKYGGSMHANQSDAALDAEYKAFLDRSQHALDNEDPARYRYFEKAAPGTPSRSFAKALRKHHLDPGASIVLMPRTEPFEQRTGHRLAWLIGTFAAVTLLWLTMVLLAPVDARASSHADKIVGKQRKRTMLGLRLFLVPSRDNYALPLLLDVNILVYVGMVFSGLGVVSFQTDDLIDWGANYGPLIHGAGVLRLFTSQFVHGGLMHILSNMYGLLFAALFLTPASTNARLLCWYLLCGLGGSLASVAMHPDTVSVGASGAIFGLFGISLTLSLLHDKRFEEAGKMIWTNAAIFVALNLAFGAIVPGIDNAAHVGGLATGVAIGAATYLYDRKRVAT